MGRLSEWRRRLASLWRREDLDRGLDDEIRFHIDQQTEKNIRSGMPAGEARRAAFVRFGGVEPLKEWTRDEFRPVVLQDVARDMRIGARVLRRAPGFAVAAIATIGLGIGAATAVFSVVNGVLLQPLPYPGADRIVRLHQIDATGLEYANVSEPNFNDWQALTHSFGVMAEMAQYGLQPVTGGDQPVLARVTLVSRDFLQVMGLEPSTGRRFTRDEQHPGGVPAALVSHAYWVRVLGAGAIADRQLRIDGQDYAVVGVMPAGFDFPGGTDVWLPRELLPPDTARTGHNFQVVARLADGASLATARADISGVSRALKVRYGDATWMSDASATPLLEQITATARPSLQILFGASLLLLLVACSNVSNLLLARGAARQREFAVQMAIGAGRFRILRQIVAETLVLGAAGGAVGVVLAVWAVRVLVALDPGNAPRLETVHVSWPAFGFAFGVTLLVALVLGVLSSMSGRGIPLAPTLSESHRTATATRRSLRAREILAATQVALTLVLLAATALLAVSFVRLQAVNPGFRTDDALVVDVHAPQSDDAALRYWVDFQDRLAARLRTLPGVEAVGVTNSFPLGGGRYSNGQFLEMTRLDEIRSLDDVQKLGPQVKERAGQAGYRVVGPGYFRAMGIPLLQGRTFTDGDAPGAPHVAVISEALARAKWPHLNPIGRFVQFGNMDGDLTPFTIVGVVGDVREVTLEADPTPLFYVSTHQRPRFASSVSVVVRGPDPTALAPTVRRIVHELDPAVPAETRTIDESLGRILAGRRFSLLLIGVFGGCALALAMLGIYGLMAYVVTQRTREIGIRMALGARRSDVLRLILGRGVVLAVAGGVVGVVAALQLTRVIQGLLFGVGAADPSVLAGVVVVTVVAALTATLVPAARAARIRAAESLRE